MTKRIFGTTHGNFRIPASKLPLIHMAVLHDYAKAGKTFESAMAYCEIGCTVDPESGDVTGLFLTDEREDPYLWETVDQYVAPFVVPGSFLVFYSSDGEVRGCAFEKDPETDRTVLRHQSATVLLEHDKDRLLHAIKDTNPGLYAELSKKYGKEQDLE